MFWKLESAPPYALAGGEGIRCPVSLDIHVMSWPARYTVVMMWYLQGGGGAGLSVDMVLFPLDTIKTRLQSEQGFYRAGGFRGLYAGVGSAAAGSIPSGNIIHVPREGMLWYILNNCWMTLQQ